MRVCVVGAGTRFLSGISYYTIRLANAFARSHDVSVVLMRQLLPTAFYPGRERVGAEITKLRFAPSVHVCDGVDWYWMPSMVRALAFVLRERPELLILQWWTGTVLHSYLLLALVARLLGARVLVEFHEVLDTGEGRLSLVRWYVQLFAPFLMRMVSGFVVHSEHDRPILEQQYRIQGRPLMVIPLGPFDHHCGEGERATREAACCNLLFFGVIRPYKGLEDLIAAFDNIPAELIDHFRLTVVGETWEGWTLPAEMIANSRYRARITFINRYVSDEEVAAYFADADAVVLPYHRSAASGPLHVAMSYGLPVVVTQVGGLPEVVAGYEGAELVPPRDPTALLEALLRIPERHGQRFADPHSWDTTATRYQELFATLLPSETGGEEVPA